MIGLLRRLWQLHQCHKRLLHNIFSLTMAQTQCPAIEDQFRSFPFVKLQTPMEFHFAVHAFNLETPTTPNLYKLPGLFGG